MMMVIDYLFMLIIFIDHSCEKEQLFSSNFVFPTNCNGVFSTQVNLHMGDLSNII